MENVTDVKTKQNGPDEKNHEKQPGKCFMPRSFTLRTQVVINLQYVFQML